MHPHFYKPLKLIPESKSKMFLTHLRMKNSTISCSFLENLAIPLLGIYPKKIVRMYTNIQSQESILHDHV